MDRRLLPLPPGITDGNPSLYKPSVIFLTPVCEHVQQEGDAVSQFLYYVELAGCMVNEVFHKDEYLQQISGRINDVHHFYAGPGGRLPGNGDELPEVVDQKLASQMLKSASFLVRYLEDEEDTFNLVSTYLGKRGLQSVIKDFYMVVNQIPLWLITVLRPSNYQVILQNHFRSLSSSPDLQLPWNMDDLPLHYLDALRHILFLSQNQTIKPQETDKWDLSNNPNRSVTELVYKGITFSPSTASLLDVRFTSSKLKLPKMMINDSSKVLLSNLIVLEVVPNADPLNGMISYINFMKSLVISTADVKLLRESEILFSNLSSDEEILDVFKTVDTFGISNNDHLLAQKIKIDRYCRRRTMKWLASLKDRHFRNPWKVTGLLVATVVVGMYATQTYCLFKDCHHL